jgi:ADP-heptose:LPS heptosyltransferase
MGDVVLCTPAIRALRRALPSARLSFASEASGVDALRGNPHLDELLLLEPGWRAALKLNRLVRGRRFDAVVDFRSTASTARVAALSGARIRIGWRGRGPRNLAYTHLLPRDGGEEYVARQKLRLLSPLGIDPERADATLELVPSPEDHLWSERIWKAHALGGEAALALSPMSRTRHKQWGAERWAAVADRLAEAGFRVLLLSGPAETAQVRAVQERMRRPALVETSAANVRELAAAYRRCLAWVGNDGGLRHVAAAAGVPTVTVFRWLQTAFWSDRDPAAQQVALEAPPRGGCDRRCDACPHLACLSAVSASTTFRPPGQTATFLPSTSEAAGWKWSASLRRSPRSVNAPSAFSTTRCSTAPRYGSVYAMISPRP